MAINYNVNPYYDDFDETKQFYRILFRPGRAVQARELTQIQTSLQKQIERFGQGIYKEGSLVVPGAFSFDTKYNYVKLTDTYGTNTSDTLVSSLINSTITGANSNVTAIVVNATTSTTTGDPPTLYVKYTSSSPYSGGINTTFQVGETITNSTGNITLQLANTSATGNGTAFSVTSGVVFTKGVFAYYDTQTLIVDKYTGTTNTIIGFQVTESTTTSTDDTSLLDPAVGASNYIAPGADRYKIALDLAQRPFTVDPNDDPNFVELVRIEDGEIISKNLDPRYSVLGDTLARRTFDESGNYTVKPYNLRIINHLRSSNTANDGYYISSAGGDDNKIMNIITPGKAYVRGYEIENVRSKYVIGEKARDYANVNNGIISSTIGNYIYITNIYSVPDLSTLASVTLYDEYNDTPGTANGNAIGTAKIRGLEFFSGTPGQTTAVYRAWLFDVSMTSGYVFERDVKQVFVDNTGYDDFTADIDPTLTVISGSVITTNGSSTITGVATKFNTELTIGDYITVGDETFRVGNVVNSTSITANSNSTVNNSGVFAFLNTTVYNDTQYLPHLFELPYTTIRTVDPTNLETSYDVKRSYSRTLSSNAVTITAGTDETFASVSTTNYTIFVTSGTHAGNVVSPTGVVTRGGSPTGKNITIDLTSLGAGYASESIVVITTIQKTNSAADKKTKTLVSNATIDFTDANTAQAAVLSLGKADIYRIVSVSMGGVAWGLPYVSSGAVDITDRYILDNGQKLTYYGIGKLSLKPNAAKPTKPIRITFDYFTHGTGDYFSVDSYGDIDYKDIPSFTSGSKTYQLRDCIDFRPRINDAGTGFTGTGAVVNDFLDPASDVQTDYSYYLPRIDKISIRRDGQINYNKGVSSLSPVEPLTPDDSMALFVLRQNAYVFDVNEDIAINQVDNKRYTMRDIGRIEKRVENLEYYTTLNLLERETQSLQIQDGDGFDRFKNGFVVDNFTGHGVGDVFNRDYGVSIDERTRELRPLLSSKTLLLKEINNTTAARTANNYVLSDDVVSLPYSDVSYVTNQKASTTENINPFSVITWIGTVTLDPPADVWFDDTRAPTIQRDEEGNYSQFLADAQSKGTYGAVWGNWETTYYGGQLANVRQGVQYDVVQQIETRTDNDVVVSSTIIPKMRSVDINFTGESLKPNTRVRVFFDDINVTNYCKPSANTGSVANASYAMVAIGNARANNLITDSTGKVTGVFTYLSDVLDLSTGEKTFRLSDSPTNGSDFETFAQTTFNSSGQLRTIRDEIVSVRNATLNSKEILDVQYVDQGGDDGGDPPPEPSPDFLDIVYQYAFGRAPDQEGRDYWTAEIAKNGYDMDAILAAATVSSSAPLSADGGVNPGAITDPNSVGANDAAVQLYTVVDWIVGGGVPNNESIGNQNGLVNANQANGSSNPVSDTAKQISYGIAAQNSGLTGATNTWSDDAQSAIDNGLSTTNTNATVNTGRTRCSGRASDPLAQSFFVDKPLYLTKVDLYFSAKDESGIPMIVELRKMVNGTPGAYIIPFSQTVVYPDNINVSDDASTATTVTFASPIYLDAGEYAIVLRAESINYRVWISEVGQTDVLTSSLISEQPYIGVLFKSQNASTWSANQYQDLKFTLYRASFSTSATATVEFTVPDTAYGKSYLGTDPLEVYPNSNVMRVYHKQHGQNTGSSIRISGFAKSNSFGSDFANSNFFGITLDQLENQVFTIADTTLDSYTITLPNTVNSNVTATIRAGNSGIVVTSDFKYDTYYPVFSSLSPTGTSLTHKVKTTEDVTYTVDTSYTTISVGDYNFDSSRTLASNTNKQVSMSNSNTFIHMVELSTSDEFVSPVIDTKKIAGVFVRNIINNPSYDSENKSTANDIVTIANNGDIIITQTAGVNGYGLITFTTASNIGNAATIIKGSYINITSNNATNDGQYRVIDVTDSGANVSIYNISGSNVTTDSTASYDITYGRNFIAEEAAFDGSAYSKYITRQVDFVNPCTAFKFYLDAAKPTDCSLEFYYKISEVGDTIDLKDKEYTKIDGVTITNSLSGEYYEVNKIVENLPQFDAIVFKIVFLGENSAQVAKCKNLRLIALA